MASTARLSEAKALHAATQRCGLALGLLPVGAAAPPLARAASAEESALPGVVAG